MKINCFAAESLNNKTVRFENGVWRIIATTLFGKLLCLVENVKTGEKLDMTPGCRTKRAKEIKRRIEAGLVS